MRFALSVGCAALVAALLAPGAPIGPGSLAPGLQLVGNQRDDVDGSDWRRVSP